MQFHNILTSIALLAGLGLSALGPVQAASKTAQDETLLEMGQAFQKNDRKRLSALLPQMRGHLLEPWAAYWELRARLDLASASEVQDFLSRYAGTYQEDRLRADWLQVLGQRRDWTAFTQDKARYRMNDDRELQCYSLVVDFLKSGTEVSAELKRQWYAQKDGDDGCNFAASQLFNAKKITPADVWQKVWLAAEANRPRVAKTSAEIIAPEAAKPVEEILNNPGKFLAKRVSTSRRYSSEWVVLALTRQAVVDPDLVATEMANHWSVQLTPAQRAWVWGVVGKSAAQRLSPLAVEHFGKANNSDLNDDLLAWKVRAALRQNRWKDVLAATQAMSADAARDNTWTYWRARALLQTGNTEAERAMGKNLLEGMASVRGFYEQLALEDLGQRISAPPRPAPLTLEEKDAARHNPGLKRALYAIQIGLRPEGVREWNYSANLHQRGGMSDRELLAAADLACQNEVWDRCINTSDRTKVEMDMAQRYPMPYKDSVLERSRKIGLDPAYVYGLIRQESRFIMDARSGVGASGLMQVMPPTARWTAKKIGMTDFKPHQITERDTNIAIGTGYLKLVLDDFAGSMPMAAAAYNAGPSRPRNWRGQTGGPVLDAAIWAENVPFQETRDYVKKVLANTTLYAAIISGQPQSLKSRLGTVGPRDSAAPDPSLELP
jgi:soluble lytic murein transglycosylase